MKGRGRKDKRGRKRRNGREEERGEKNVMKMERGAGSDDKEKKMRRWRKKYKEGKV